jgi:hypothetical protein
LVVQNLFGVMLMEVRDILKVESEHERLPLYFLNQPTVIIWLSFTMARNRRDYSTRLVVNSRKTRPLVSTFALFPLLSGKPADGTAPPSGTAVSATESTVTFKPSASTKAIPSSAEDAVVRATNNDTALTVVPCRPRTFRPHPRTSTQYKMRTTITFQP